MAQATFAAGCFWGVEEAFRTLPGVTKTTVGYTGGTVESPTYERVCSGRTGHAESVLVEYDPARVTYEQLLDVFWNEHDPTTLNRQGPDVGTQYRSAVFFHDAAQQAAASASKERLGRSSPRSSPRRRSTRPRSTTSSTSRSKAAPATDDGRPRASP